MADEAQEVADLEMQLQNTVEDLLQQHDYSIEQLTKIYSAAINNSLAANAAKAASDNTEEETK